MASLSEDVRRAWEDRDGPVILATVSKEGMPKQSEHCALLAANTLKAACEYRNRRDHFWRKEPEK